MQEKLCRNVGELIAELQKFPADTKLLITGSDIGGYDVSDFPFGYVIQTSDGSVTIDHGECEAWNDYEKHKITYEEFEEMYGK